MICYSLMYRNHVLYDEDDLDNFLVVLMLFKRGILFFKVSICKKETIFETKVKPTMKKK